MEWNNVHVIGLGDGNIVQKVLTTFGILMVMINLSLTDFVVHGAIDGYSRRIVA